MKNIINKSNNKSNNKSKFIGEIVRLKLGSWDINGQVSAQFEDNLVLVSGGIPGEVVEVKIIKEFPKYLAAVVTQVLKP